MQGHVMHRHHAERVSVAQQQRAKFGFAEARRVRQHGIEDRLQFSGRTTDYAEHLRGRGLLLQRLGKVPPCLG